jgi:hypothetical protein
MPVPFAIFEIISIRQPPGAVARLGKQDNAAVTPGTAAVFSASRRVIGWSIMMMDSFAMECRLFHWPKKSKP